MALTPRGLAILNDVHPDLTRVVLRAAASGLVDFIVLEGLRTLERQRELKAAGASSTMNSRHLTGHAVDLGVVVAGQLRWDWPLYHRLAAVMKAAANELGIALEAGADWTRFPDGPHFQLPWDAYPGKEGEPIPPEEPELEPVPSVLAPLPPKPLG